MNEEETRKWFDDNGLCWISEWVGLRFDIHGNPYSIRNEIRDVVENKLVIEWYSRSETMSDKIDRAKRYLTQKNRINKLSELGI